MNRTSAGLLGLAATSALAAAAAACSSLPIICPAVGYSSTLTITLAEPRDDVALELCVVEGCVPHAPDDVPADQPIEVCRTESCITATPDESAPATDDGIWMLDDDDGLDGWRVSIFTGGEVVAYRLLAADGTVVGEGETRPDWVRVGGTEQCGGPREAEVVLG